MSDRLDNSGSRDVWEAIRSFNVGRDPVMLERKYSKMRKNALSFFRGTCHLFYRDLPVASSLNLAPYTWICGDLHLENFGAYKGDDRQIYFGINDFDEGMLAPCTWDVARLVTSIFLAAESLSLDNDEGERMVRAYLNRYAETLSSGSIRAIVADNAKGLVADLLKKLARRKRQELLDERTELIGDRRQLIFDDEKILKIDRDKYELVSRVIFDWAQTQDRPDFFEVLDIGFRVAGTGSLGLDRYLILVAGKGSPDRNYLLDFKQQPLYVLPTFLNDTQPQWENSAKRVMKIEQLVQSAPPALLAAIDFNNSSYLLRELQPTQDKVELKDTNIDIVGEASPLENRLEKLVKTMAEVTAFAHLHGSGKLGAAIAQELIDFGESIDWQQEVLIYANNYARQVRSDYQDFCEATSER
jgi:uncharacterized protein (DUF2252 family)